MLKLILISTVFILSFIKSSFSQDFNEEYGNPKLVFIETNPWLMVIGSDVPFFALYESGHIIYRTTKDGSHTYYEVKYNDEEVEDLIRSLNISDDLYNQPDYIDASQATDQPSNILVLNLDTIKQIVLYGSLSHKKSEARKEAPKCFVTLFDQLKSFNDESAKKWLPEKIEVLLTGYSHSPEKPKKWPKDWPNLESSNSVQRNENLYSIYLPSKYFDDFIELISSLELKQAIEVNGKMFSVAYRFPFPNVR